MKLLYIIPSLFRTSPNYIVLRLLEGMLQHGHSCEIWYFDDGPDGLAFPCEARRISLFRVPDFSDYDIVHTYGMRPNLYVFLYKPFGSRHRPHFVATNHSYIFEEFRSLYGLLKGTVLSHIFLTALRRHDLLIMLSHDAISYYGRWIDSRKMACCYNGVRPAEEGMEDADLSVIARFKAGGILLGDICFLDTIKCVGTIISALRFLPDRYRLLLVGEGDDEALLKRQAAEEVPGRVLFLGPRRHGAAYLAPIDIFVQSASSEGFCLSMTEAALAGKRIVSSDIPGMREKYAEDEVVYYRPEGSPEDRARRLAEAVLKAGADETIGPKAQAKAREAFSVDRMISRHIELYEQLV